MMTSKLIRKAVLGVNAVAIFTVLFATSFPAYSGNKAHLIYQGRIVMPSGVAENSPSVIFTYQIIAPNGCVLWEETSAPIDMSNTRGVFSTLIGEGKNTAGGNLAWNKVFKNGMELGYGQLMGSSFAAELGLAPVPKKREDKNTDKDEFKNNGKFKFGECPGSYSGKPYDDRTLFARVNDGIGGDQTVGPVPIKATGQDALFGGYPVIGEPTDGQLLTFSSVDQSWYPGEAAAGIQNITALLGSPIHIAGTTSHPIVGITKASNSTDGFLSSKDWVQFNNKLDKSLAKDHIWVGDSSQSAQPVSVMGDGKLSASGNLTVTGIQGVPLALKGIRNGQVLRYNVNNDNVAQWEALDLSSVAATGAAGGDLSGTYPSPKISKINGVTVDSQSVAGGFLAYDNLTRSWKGKAFPSCRASQTPYYNPISDKIECQDIPQGDWTKLQNKPTDLKSYGITDAVQNAGLSRSFQAGLDSRRPIPGVLGRFYASTDTREIYYDNGSQWILLASGLPDGVTSVSLALPDIFDVVGGPITGAGMFVVSLADEPEKTFFAGPRTGEGHPITGVAHPTFRTITSADLPSNGYDSTYFKNGGNNFGEAYLGTKNANDLILKTNDIARITVASNGQVGIGTTTPTAKLEVAGGATKLEQPSWTIPSLLGNWQNVEGEYAKVSYRIDSMGYLHIRGLAKTAASNTQVGSARPIFTLPANYQPTRSSSILAPLTCNGGARIIINSSGSVYVDSVMILGSCATYEISLDNILIPLD